MKKPLNVSFLDLVEIQKEHVQPISNSVEKLKEIFFSRYTYKKDEDWLIDVASCVVHLCEETGNDDHYMYPVEEFIESYVSG